MGVDAATLEAQREAAVRLAAAAALAGCLDAAGGPAGAQEPPRLAQMRRWALAAAGERRLPGARSSRSAASGPDVADSARLLSSLFAGLRRERPARARQLAQAEDAVRTFLAAAGRQGGDAGIESRLRIPILLALGEQGLVAWLWIERMAGGTGQYFQAASTLLDPVRADARAAMEAAWAVAAGIVTGKPRAVARDFNVRWRLAGLPCDAAGNRIPIQGDSLQAAAAVGLALLLQGRLYDSACAISATVGADGHLGGVEGILSPAAPKLAAARELAPPRGRATVVVAPDNAPAEADRELWEQRGVRIVAVSSVIDALPLASGLAEDFERLFQREGDRLLEEAGPGMPAAFVPPLLCPVPGRGEPGGEAAAVTWPDLPHREDGRPHRQVVILGEAGSGKSMLLVHEIGRRNRLALAALRGALDPRLPAPAGSPFSSELAPAGGAVYVRAVELAAGLADAPGAGLLETVSGLLARRHRLRDETRDALHARLADGHCLLAIDGLDEVSDGAGGAATPPAGGYRLRLLEALGESGRRFPEAAILLATRRSGYAGPPFAAGTAELELLPFDDDRIRSALGLWLGEPAHPVAELLFRQIALLPALRSPLMLRLACVAADPERAEASQSSRLPPAAWRRRGDLLEAFLQTGVEQWRRRADPPAGEEQGALLLSLAADVAGTLRDASRPGGTAGPWSRAAVAQAINAARGRWVALNERPDLLADLQAAGILVSAPGGRRAAELAFPHPVFGDYLVARSLADRSWGEVRDEALRRAWDPGWPGVGIFLAGRLADPAVFLDALVLPGTGAGRAGGDDLFRHRLGLAAHCLPECVPDGDVVDRVTESAFLTWWDRRLANPPEAALLRVAAALGALGEANGRIGGVPLRDWLCDRLTGDDAIARTAAAEAIAGMGPAAATPGLLEALARMLGEADPDRRAQALRTAMGLGAAAASPAVLDRLLGWLSEPGRSAEAIVALRCLRGPAARRHLAEPLAQLLSQPDPGPRPAAARAAGALGPWDSPPAPVALLERLAALLEEPSAGIRQAALEGLARSGLLATGAPAAMVEPVLDQVVARLADPDPGVRSGACEALISCGQSALTSLRLTLLSELLAAADPGPRAAAARVLRRLGRASASSEARDRLVDLLPPASGLPPRAAPPAPAALPLDAEPLVDLLAGPDPDLREAAAIALAGADEAAVTGPHAPRLIELLGGLLRDEEPGIRCAAAGAIGRLGAPAATDEVLGQLQQMLRQPAPPAAAAALRRAAAAALEGFVARGIRIFEEPSGRWYARTVADLTSG